MKAVCNIVEVKTITQFTNNIFFLLQRENILLKCQNMPKLEIWFGHKSPPTF